MLLRAKKQAKKKKQETTEKQKTQRRIHTAQLDGQITADGTKDVAHATYISRQVRGRDPGHHPCRHLSRVRPQSVQAVHVETHPPPSRGHGPATSTPERPVHSTPHEDYAEAEASQNAIAVTSTATQPDECHAARHCGILAVHGDGPYSHHARRPGSVGASPHKGEWCHVEWYQLPHAHAPSPAPANDVLVLAPILARGLDRAFRVRGHDQAVRSCCGSWRAPFAGDYGVGLTPGSLLANASESATQVSGNLTPAARAVEDGAHKHSSDVLVVRGRKHDTQVGNHGK